ncbi:MAG: right-handed parallel beta-helix repeat-containing protein [Eubacteriales bacterium]|nr:right-handed parallel beta-helix repeat-containing protein [Eubacteriales bacterium]
MKLSRIFSLFLLMLLAVCLAAPCAAAADAPVLVSDARGLLEAIAPDTTILLAPGRYNLSEAIGEIRNNGEMDWLAQHPALLFEDMYDGCGVLVRGVDGLTIRGTGEVELVTEPRYADVLRFERCHDLALEGMTMGHTPEAGACTGDVLDFTDCERVTLRALDLYGCGAYGVSTLRCSDLRGEDCVIRDCSYGLLHAEATLGLRFVHSELRGCGGYNLLELTLSSLCFEDCVFENNATLWGFLSQTEGNALLFAGCSFGDWESAQLRTFSGEDGPVRFDERCVFSETGGNRTVTVASAEELFDAIRPGAAIFVQPGRYDLSAWIDETWREQGSAWNERHPFVRLQECYDGVEVVISGADGLSIMGLGAGRDETELTVTPRYADVLGFENCIGVSLANMTIGHTEGADCSGSVLYFDSSTDILLTNLDLYGCGTLGVYSFQSGALTMRGCHVHDCVYGPAEFYSSWGELRFEDCIFADSTGGFNFIECPTPYFQRCVFGAEEYASLAARGDVELEDCWW